MSRFTIEFSDEIDKQIEMIQNSTGATTKAEVVRRALGLLKYVVEEQREGSKLILENQKQKVRKEVVTI